MTTVQTTPQIHEAARWLRRLFKRALMAYDASLAVDLEVIKIETYVDGRHFLIWLQYDGEQDLHKIYDPVLMSEYLANTLGAQVNLKRRGWLIKCAIVLPELPQEIKHFKQPTAV